jgi:hypothetical protein
MHAALVLALLLLLTGSANARLSKRRGAGGPPPPVVTAPAGYAPHAAADANLVADPSPFPDAHLDLLDSPAQTPNVPAVA